MSSEDDNNTRANEGEKAQEKTTATSGSTLESQIGFNPMRYRLGGAGSTTASKHESGSTSATSRFARFSFWDDDSDDEWSEPSTIEEKRKLYRCGGRYNTLEKILTWEEYAAKKKITNAKKSKRVFPPNAELNKKISLWEGDSTTLEIDAIVNAANSSLLGGGGIDGAIHSAAGSFLRKECATLNGCSTGQTKITKGYKLPAKHVLHTVGPISENPTQLESCYTTCLNLVEKNKIKSVAFCCIATGIYGYPLYKATKIALTTCRKWLETNDNYQKVDRIIFVVFLEKELRCYEKLLPRFFPLPLTKEEEEKEAAEPQQESKEESSDEDTPKFSSYRFMMGGSSIHSATSIRGDPFGKRSSGDSDDD